MKKILGLDLGTNSIGWALLEQDFEHKQGTILGMGSRIIPMDEGIKGKFEDGISVSQTAERTRYRSVRRLRERNLLRRERLHRVLNVLGFLPEHYANSIDFEKHFGKFKNETEPKLAWKKNGKKKNGKDKFEFIFQDLFDEMLADFKHNQPELLNRKNRNNEPAKIPYDWAIYYLRKKALTEKIKKEELAWLILNFNQKRGYYQLRGEVEETTSEDSKKESVLNLKVVGVKKGEVDKKNNKKTWYSITFENGWVHSFPFTAEPNWLNTEREFIVTEEYNKETGEIKIVKDNKKDTVGREKRSLSVLPSFEEIELMSKKEQDKIYKKIKARTKLTISNSKKTVGSYIYETLLKNPTQKIRGKLVRTIERKFYKDELKAILEKQVELQPELFTDELYNACVRELYRSNEAHRVQLSKKDFVHLFLEDIIFYQRPLRSQKSSIGNCSLEFREHKVNVKDEKGNPIKNKFEKDINGKDILIKEYLKAIPKSNPYYQEFRVWQWLHNLKIYNRKDDTDATEEFLKSIEDKERLFEFLMTKTEVNHYDVLEYLLTPGIKERFPDAKPKAFKNELNKEISKYRWNYVFDDAKEKEGEKSKAYPMNETGYEIRKRLEKVESIPVDFLTRDIEQNLWHIIYSVTDPKEYEKALKSFADKHQLGSESFVAEFKKFPPFKSDYGTYSEKAIKKLLPLMRVGKYWDGDVIVKNSTNYFNNIQQLLEKLSKKEGAITKEQKEKWNKDINRKLYDELNLFNDADISLFQGLQLHIAQYLVYGRHSESADISQWTRSYDVQNYLYEFKQHSLRNPIVEQVITETLRVVKDIWKHFGKGEENFFDEIHVELGREMKNTAEERKRLTNIVSENEATNQRIKLLLMELKNDSSIENVREYSPSQQEILKIYEDGVLSYFTEQKLKEEVFQDAGKEEAKNVYEISRKAQPNKSELIRYKLWLEQKYQSPYTGEIIPLSKLFTPAYEIEHIIPQSRYFDDSLSNKIICEAEVNKLKDNQLGLEFIQNHFGEKVQIGEKEVSVFTVEKYKQFVEEHYTNNRNKRTKLLLDDIPEKFIARQLNDTRYISKYVSQILSNIVRADENDDGVNSKNLILCNGQITDRLKQDWGLNDIWNSLILPRFERMNQLTHSTKFTTKNKEGHTIPQIPFELSKGFQKKRIDHRHHAMDALVIACATRDHVNLLNNQSAKSENIRIDLQNKLRNKEKWTDRNGREHDKFTTFKKPWENFTVDTKNELEKIVVSFKQNLRVINKATNYYQKFKNGKKVEEEQKGTNWAIRKPLHKATVFGKVYLLNKTRKLSIKKALIKVNELKDMKIIVNEKQRVAISKYFNENNVDIENALKDPFLNKFKEIEIYEVQSATRQGNDLVSIFKDVKTKNKAEGVINNITDTGIQKILLKHLLSKENNPEIAYSPEGIEEMNKNIVSLNNNTFHQPIIKVRMYETIGNKFPVGESGNKQDKYVEADKGTNLFFAVYEYEEFDKKKERTIKKRSFETLPLNEVIERQKQGLSPVPDMNKEGHSLIFYLSPNDLVYVPTKEELESNTKIDIRNLTKEQRSRIYRFTDGSGKMANFIPVNIANVLFNMNKDKQKKTFGKELFAIQNEIGVGSQGSKNENATTGEQIKSICIKLSIDRLGNISKTQ